MHNASDSNALKRPRAETIIDDGRTGAAERDPPAAQARRAESRCARLALSEATSVAPSRLGRVWLDWLGRRPNIGGGRSHIDKIGEADHRKMATKAPCLQSERATSARNLA